MIYTPFLLAGFGNRLYQIAHVLNIAKKYNGICEFVSLTVKPERFGHYKSGVAKLKDYSEFGGHDILINYDWQPKRIKEIFPKLNWSDNYIDIDDYLNGKQFISGEYNVDQFSYLDQPKHYVFKGYWFEMRYFYENIEYIRTQLEPSEQIINYINSTYNDLLDNATSIHLRMGIPTDNFGATMQPDDFYREVLERTKGTNYLIFADNPVLAEKFISRFNIKYKVISNEPMYIDMFLMSKCKNNVLGLSTLSAWASFLNTVSDRTIYYSNKWLTHHFVSKLPDDWIKI